jgi:hypothetical protein
MYFMGFDQRNMYERVIVNRKEKTTCIDRIDMNWLYDQPFVGRRDEFTPAIRHENGLDFYRYHYWL